MNGLLIINKPKNCTSMDVIRKVRKLTGIKKIGHAGTLDPIATGVLLLCLGKSTKKINLLMNMQKEYVAQINLTAFSETDDVEGSLTKINIDKIPNEEEIEKILTKFIGTIDQIPPKFSAIKINGVRAYKKALSGEIFDLQSRKVTIFSIELINYEWPFLDIKVNCSKGTYIRSLARDIGKSLNTGGYITKLIRTAIGEYNLKKSLDLDKTDFLDLTNIEEFHSNY